MLSELSFRANNILAECINQNGRVADFHQIHTDSDEAEKFSDRSLTKPRSFCENQSAIKLEEEKASIRLKNLLCCLKKNSADANLTFGDFIYAFGSERKNARGKERICYFIEYFHKRHLDASSIQLIIKLFTDISKLGFTLTKHLAHDSDSQFLKTFHLFRMLHAIRSWNATPYILRNETKLSSHLVCKNHPQSLKMSQKNKHANKSSDSANLNKSDITGKECKIARELNLLCVFTNDVDSEKTTSNLNISWTNEDIKMILPMQWNIVVAYNVITVSDANKNIIRILFRNPLNIKADHDSFDVGLELFSPKKFSSNKTAHTIRKPKNNNIRNVQIGNSSTSYNKLATINKKRPRKDKELAKKAILMENENSHDKFAASNKKRLRKSNEPEKKDIAIKNENCLSLDEPLLLNCTKGKAIKQILMYKEHSFPHYSGKESKNFCKLLQDLVSKSVRYRGEPIHLIFDPLKVISNLRHEEGINSLIQLRSCKGKEDLTKVSGLKPEQCMKIKENGGFRNVISMTMNVTSVNGKQQVPDDPSNGQDAKCLQDSELQKSMLPFSEEENSTNSIINESHQEKKKLKIRRRKKSMTALKRVNVKKIVKSVFRNFFHFYSLLGGHIRSGAVITKSNSNYWLKVSGVATDSSTLQLAGELFTATAGTKVVLNIYDYLKFLIVFARSRKIIVAELVEQMMVCGSKLSIPIQKYQTISTLKNQTEELPGIHNKNNQLRPCQSMPNLRNCY